MKSVQTEHGLASVSRRVLADDVVDAIRAAIVTGKFEAGRRLIEDELANQLQVSRGPVREALARLEQEGLVVNERHRGSTVTKLSVGEVDEIYSLRTALERLAAEWVCRTASDDDLAEIRRVLEMIDTLPRPLTQMAYANLDIEFHDAIFRAAHHDRLYRAWTALRSQISLFLLQTGALRPDFARTWRDDHEECLAALKSRKPSVAVKQIEKHIEDTYRRVLATEERQSHE
jgi:DNA-binding GntR family transcriptional regulator